MQPFFSRLSEVGSWREEQRSPASTIRHLLQLILGNIEPSLQVCPRYTLGPPPSRTCPSEHLVKEATALAVTLLLRERPSTFWSTN